MQFEPTGFDSFRCLQSWSNQLFRVSYALGKSPHVPDQTNLVVNGNGIAQQTIQFLFEECF